MVFTEEMRAKGRATVARNRAARRAALQQASASGMGTPGASLDAGAADVPGGGSDAIPDLEVEVKTGEPAPRGHISLKDRILGRMQSQPQAVSKTRQRAGGKQEIALAKVLPGMASLALMTIARDRFPDEYKPCAPTKAEVDAIINPLLAIISRRIEITGKVSQDTLDLTNSLTFMLAYAVRAYCTYVEIKHQPKKEQEPHATRTPVQSEQPAAEPARPVSEPPAESALAGGMRAYQEQASGASGNSAGINGERSGGGNNNGNGASSDLDAEELRKYEAGLVAQMFKRDRAGRVGLGLLPGSV